MNTVFPGGSTIFFFFAENVALRIFSEVLLALIGKRQGLALCGHFHMQSFVYY